MIANSPVCNKSLAKIQTEGIGFSNVPLQCMIANQSPNFLNINDVKKRLTSYVDYQMGRIAARLDKQPTKRILFNESLLEEWLEILTKMVYLKDAKAIQTKPLTVITDSHSQNEAKLAFLPLPGPAHSSREKGNFLLNIDTNTVDIYDFSHLTSRRQKYQHKKLTFKKGFARKFCTYHFENEQNIILIGGSRQSNPNLKSKEILRLHIANHEIAQLAELPYSISSHSSIKIGHIIYIIGGNKDLNVVTKNCCLFNLETKTASEMASLNYPSASHTTVSWKNNFIYKIGGIGSCFGQWDLSPYIERYCIESDEWAIINPELAIKEHLLDQYSLLVNSLAYVSNRNSIIILGGFDLNYRGCNKVLQIEIKDEANDEAQCSHVIKGLGVVQDLWHGGFLHQQPIILQEEIIVLHTCDQKSHGFTHRIVSLSSKAQYL